MNLDIFFLEINEQQSPQSRASRRASNGVKQLKLLGPISPHQYIDFDMLQRRVKNGRYLTAIDFDNEMNQLFVHLKSKSTGNALSLAQNLEQAYYSKKEAVAEQVKKEASEELTARTKLQLVPQDPPKELYWAINVPLVGTYDIEKGVASELWAEPTAVERDDVHCICGWNYEDGKHYFVFFLIVGLLRIYSYAGL